MLKIGIIGCGSIGAEICKAIDTGIIEGSLVAIYDRSLEHCDKLISKLNNKPNIVLPDELIEKSDIVVECASQTAVYELGELVLSKGKDLMVLSVGAFSDKKLLDKFLKLATKNNCKIYIPSGAVAGIDGLNSASSSNITKVILTTTKSPDGLKGAPFVIENNIDLYSFHEKTLIFEGCANDAIKAFPANVNVASTISLAGIGTKKTQVRVFLDPKATRNTHELYVEGNFGKFTVYTENFPSIDNPKTSYLASLSAISTLKKITEPLQIGT